MISVDKRRHRIPHSLAELYADAPIAVIDYDNLSSDSKHRDIDRPRFCAQSEENLSLSLNSLEFEMPFHGSLSDLVLNFEERIRSPQCSTISLNPTGYRHASLSQVKFWWTEAVEEFSASVYPLGEVPEKLGLYDELEPVDVDGITEDSDVDLAKNVINNRLDVSVQHSNGSFQGHVTTDSESLSSASPQPTPVAYPIETSTIDNSKCHSNDSSLMNSTTSLQGTMNAFPESIQSSDLIQFSVKLLRRHIDGLNSDIMQQSDKLVELLAERDELIMLREASDDFVILLSLLHQRRARASRAALKTTARSLLRPKGFSRLRSSWFAKVLVATSTSNQHSSGDSSNLDTGFINPSECNRSTSPGACSSAFEMNSLHLASKRRRPVSQPIKIPVRESRSPTSQLDTTQDSITSMKVDSSPSFPSTEQARRRLIELRNLCETLGWPNNQPGLSRSLRLRLPFIIGHGRILSKLRVINQIFYGTLLENPNTEYLVKTYWDEVKKASQVNAWIVRSSGEIHDFVQFPVTSCNNNFL